MAKHVKEINFQKGRVTYTLEIDTEDPENLVIESVTIIDSPDRNRLEEDIDPEEFADSLDIDDWQQIKEKLA